MDLRQRFATNLRRIRNDRGVSQEGLANDAGIDRAYLSRVERAVTLRGAGDRGGAGRRPGRRPGRVLPSAGSGRIEKEG